MADELLELLIDLLMFSFTLFYLLIWGFYFRKTSLRIYLEEGETLYFAAAV